MVTKKRFSEDGETPPEKRRMILADSKAALDAFNPSDNSKNGVITPILDSEEWAPPSEVARTNSASKLASHVVFTFLYLFGIHFLFLTSTSPEKSALPQHVTLSELATYS